MNDAAMESMVMFYSLWLFQIFQRIGFEESKKLALAADAVCQENPLHLCCGTDQTWDMPHIGKASAGKLLAVIAAVIVWTQREAGIEELPDSPFLSAADSAYKLWKETRKYEQESQSVSAL